MFWIRLYYALIIVFAIYSFSLFIYFLKHRKLAILKWIERARRDGRIVEGRLSCLKAVDYDDITSSKGQYAYEYEYAYKVNNKIYYVTYQMPEPVTPHAIARQKMYDEYLTYWEYETRDIFYSKRNPHKCHIKHETILPKSLLKQVKTKKNNAYRDLVREWTKEECIDERSITFS